MFANELLLNRYKNNGLVYCATNSVGFYKLNIEVRLYLENSFNIKKYYAPAGVG